MTKELEELEKVGKQFEVHISKDTIVSYNLTEGYLIIKKALKDYLTLKREYDFGVEHYNELLNRYNKEHKALEIVKELFDFDFAIRFGDNQPMIKITNKRNGQHWELPETTEICDLLKKVLL